MYNLLLDYAIMRQTDGVHCEGRMLCTAAARLEFNKFVTLAISALFRKVEDKRVLVSLQTAAVFNGQI